MDGGSARREGGGGARSEAVSNLPPASEARALHALVFFLLEPERSFVTLTPANCAVSSGITFFPANRPPDWSSEVCMNLAAITSSAAVINAKILSQLSAAAKMRSMSAQARLPFDLMPGPCSIGVRKRGQQLGLTAPYEARVWRVVLEVLIRLLVHGLDVKYVPVGAVR